MDSPISTKNIRTSSQNNLTITTTPNNRLTAVVCYNECMKKTHPIAQLFGWYGVIAILSAYALASFDILSPRDWQFQLLNATGALAMILEGSQRKDWQPVVLNVVWATIAIIGLIRGLIY